MKQQLDADQQKLMEDIRAAYNASNFPLICKLCDEAARQYPNISEFLALYSHSILWRGKPDEARVSIQKAIELNAQCDLAWGALANLDSFQGNIDEAIQAANKALALNSFDPLTIALSSDTYTLNGQHDIAIDVVSRYCERFSDDTMVHQHITLLLDAGRSNEAWDLLDNALQEFPDSPHIWHLKARRFLWTRQLTDAIDLLTRVVGKLNGAYEYWGELASTLNLAGRLEEAEAAAKRSLEICPCAVLAMQTMSKINAQQGREIEAAEWHNKAIKAIPALSVQMTLSRANIAIRQEDWDTVLSITESALSTPNARRVALSQRIRAFIHLNRIEEADDTLEELRKVDNISKDIYEFQGRILREKGDFDGAITVLKTGTAEYPTDGILRAELLRILNTKGLWEEELALAQDIIEYPPDIPAGFSEAYMALSDTKHLKEAKSLLQLARERYPNVESFKLFDAVQMLESGNYHEAKKLAHSIKGDMIKPAKLLSRTALMLNIFSKIFFFIKKRKPSNDMSSGN